MRGAVGRVAEKCPANAATLAADADLQDIVVLNLTRSIQLCVDIARHIIAASSEPPPATMGEAFATLAKLGILDAAIAANLRRAVGFRNIAVRNCEKVDWNIVHALCNANLDDFRQFAKAVAALLDGK